MHGYTILRCMKKQLRGNTLILLKIYKSNQWLNELMAQMLSSVYKKINDFIVTEDFTMLSRNNHSKKFPLDA